MTVRNQLDAADRLRAAGHDAGARSAYASAATDAAARFQPDLEARALLGVGELAALAEDWKAAGEALDGAVARAMEGGVPLVEADAWFALATAAFDQGRSKDGHDALLEAMAICRALDGEEARRRLARAVRVYGEHLGVLGSPDDAKQALELARVMHADLGDDATARAIADDLLKISEYAR